MGEDKLERGTHATTVLSTPDIDELKSHFEEKGKSEEQSILLCEINRENYIPVLDDDFTEEEVVIVVKQRKGISQLDMVGRNAWLQK